MSDQIDTSAAQQCCVGANIRRTDRVVTQFYEEMLAPSGLNGPQFWLLATLAKVAPITIHRLAEIMDIDRTTLTPNSTSFAMRKAKIDACAWCSSPRKGSRRSGAPGRCGKQRKLTLSVHLVLNA